MWGSERVGMPGQLLTRRKDALPAALGTHRDEPGTGPPPHGPLPATTDRRTA